MSISKSVVLVLLLVSLPMRCQTPAQTSGPLRFTLKEVGHNTWAAIDDAKGDAGANAGFVIGDDGVAVIDTFEHPEAAKQLLAEIRKRTKLPIKFVINTHYHIDHVAGNHVFQDAGAIVFAQRNVRSWIHTQNLKFFSNDITPEQRAMVNELGDPDVVYDSAVDLFLGSQIINVRFFPGHTGGDSVVTLRDSRVLFCGDLFWRQTLPNLIDASTDSWIETLQSLKSFPSMTFVPGHGDVGTSSDVATFQAYLKDLRAMAKAQLDAGKHGEDLVIAVLPQLQEKYGKWDFFEDFAKPDIRNVGDELSGKKKTPPLDYPM